MDPVNVIQLAFAGTAVVIFGRLGFALTRYVERRLAAGQRSDREAETRLQTVEDECSHLRQELSDLHERQDFTERFLHRGPDRAGLPQADGADNKVVTPH